MFWKDYVFTRTFDVDEELLAQQHIVLVCEGLDTLAEISINGTFLAKTDNMHRTWKFQAKKLLHPGKNEIQIVFRSVLRFIEDYPYEAHKKVCGVCGGIANYFDVDPTVIRLIWVIFTLVGGSGLIAYIIAAIIMPDEM